MTADIKKDLQDEICRLNVSAETKVAFIKYLGASDKKDIQYYRRTALYGFFCSERRLRCRDSMRRSICFGTSICVKCFCRIYEDLPVLTSSALL